jgi:hypothetical protein
MNAGFVPSTEPTTASMSIPPMTSGEDLVSYTQRATGMGIVDPRTLASRNDGPKVAEQKSKLQEALNAFARDTADLQQRQLVAAEAAVGAAVVRPLANVLSQAVGDISAQVNKIIQTILVPLYEDLTMFWPGFDDALFWKDIEGQADQELQFLLRLERDGTPAKQDNPNPTQPVKGPKIATKDHAATYEWDSDAGAAYRSVIPDQQEAVSRVKEIAAKLNDSVGPVATFTVFLTAAVLITVVPVLIVLLVWIARAIRAFAAFVSAALRGINRAVRAIEWTAQGLRQAAEAAARAVGDSAVWLYNKLAGQLRSLMTWLRGLKADLDAAIVSFGQQIVQFLKSFGASSINLALTVLAYLYGVNRATEQVQSMLFNEQGGRSSAFPQGHWPNPCNYQQFTDPVFTGTSSAATPSTPPVPTTPTNSYRSIIYDLNYIARHQRFWCNNIPVLWRPVTYDLGQMAVRNRPSILLADFLAAYEQLTDFMKARSGEAVKVFSECFCTGLGASMKRYQDLEDRQRNAIGYLAAQTARAGISVVPGALPPAATTPPPPPKPPPPPPAPEPPAPEPGPLP